MAESNRLEEILRNELTEEQNQVHGAEESVTEAAQKLEVEQRLNAEVLADIVQMESRLALVQEMYASECENAQRATTSYNEIEVEYSEVAEVTKALENELGQRTGEVESVQTELDDVMAELRFIQEERRQAAELAGKAQQLLLGTG